MKKLVVVAVFALMASRVYSNALKTDALPTSVQAEPLPQGTPVQKIVVENPAQIVRDCETITLDWKKIRDISPDITKDNVAVFDVQTNQYLVTQVIEADTGGQLLFQTNLAPGQKKHFWLTKRPQDSKKPDSNVRTFCRFVPERLDDFAWENDKIAFRVYGPALWTDIVNSGVDCWLKRVPYPIIDKWYGQMKEKTYHVDWGEGNDPYHVGKTTGCGGLRIIEGEKFLYSNVYDTWKVIANGPIRSIFELTYDKSWKESGKNLVETRRISIDLGQRLCRLESRFEGPDAAAIRQFALGLTTHDGKAKSGHNPSGDIVYCWEKMEGAYLGTAAICLSPDIQKPVIISSKNKDESHIYLVVNKTEPSAVTWYIGYGWEKAGEITTLDAWQAYLFDYREKMCRPVTIEYE